MKRTALGALIALGAMASVASAGFIGQSFDAAYYFPNDTTVYPDASFAPPSFVVGAGVETVVETVGDVEGVTMLPVDFTDHTLTITLNTVLPNPTWTSVAFNGPIFSLTSLGGLDISSFSVNPATTLPGFDASRVLVTSDRVGINWGGLGYQNGMQVVVDFTFVPVPEPGTIVLASLAALGLVAAPSLRPPSVRMLKRPRPSRVAAY